MFEKKLLCPVKMVGGVGCGAGGKYQVEQTSPVSRFLKIALNHAQLSIFGTYLHTGYSMAVAMANNRSVKKANTRVIVAKTVVTVDYLSARSKPRSLWNCEIHFTTESRPDLQ